jgi:phosphoribosylformimino-5-aminoimidazole carboxamide ribotide isomerase
MSFEVVPSIDLRNGQVVRLQQGDYARQINYPLDPIETAKRFEQAGATWIHLVDLDGAKAGRPTQLDLLKQIASATNLHVQIGGGVRSTEDVETLLDLGANRVVVGTKAIEDWTWFSALARHQDFAHRLTLALDAKDGLVATHAWTQTTGRRATDIAAEVSDWPVACILYTDVAKDGMLQGPNIPNTVALAQAGNVPVCASGGVGSLDHIR